MKQLICVTGMDGVGKSTLVEALARQLENVQVVNIWDLLESPIKSLPFKSKKDIDDFLCALTPDSRLLFLAHALKYAIDKAMQTEATLLLLNGYFYKYFATEKILGAQSELILSLQKSFPQPDLNLQLILPVTTAVERKKVLSRYECGLHPSPDTDAFISFQNRVETAWQMYDRKAWQFLDARKNPQVLLAESLQIIKDKIHL